MMEGKVMKSRHTLTRNLLLALGGLLLATATVTQAKPKKEIKKSQVEFVSMKFFESGATAPAESEREFALKFSKSESRYIFAQINIKNLKRAQQTFKLRAEYYRPNGSYMGGPEKTFTIASDTTTRNYLVGWGWPTSGHWSKGVHKVKLYIDNMLVGTKEFTVVPMLARKKRKQKKTARQHAYNKPEYDDFTDQEDTDFIRGDRLPHLVNKQQAGVTKKNAAHKQKVVVANVGRHVGVKQPAVTRSDSTAQDRNYPHTAQEKREHRQFGSDRRQASLTQHDRTAPAAQKSTRNSFPTPKLIGKIKGKFSMWQVENDTAHPLFIRYQAKGGNARSLQVAPYTIENIYLRGGNYLIHGSLNKKSVREFSKNYYFTTGGKYLSRFVIRNNQPPRQNAQQIQ